MIQLQILPVVLSSAYPILPSISYDVHAEHILEGVLNSPAKATRMSWRSKCSRHHVLIFCRAVVERVSYWRDRLYLALISTNQPTMPLNEFGAAMIVLCMFPPFQSNHPIVFCGGWWSCEGSGSITTPVHVGLAKSQGLRSGGTGGDKILI